MELINYPKEKAINLIQKEGFTNSAAEEIYDYFQAEYEFNGLTLPFHPEDWEEININPTDEEIANMRDGETIIHRTCVGTIVKGKVNLKIKNWYIKNYPDDDLGQDIDPDITFKDVYEHLENFYDIIKVADSVIRERIFEELAKLTNQTYDKIYKIWLGEK